ncbi:hypothetical protein ES703_97832 [subsurface metagenome]
MKPLIWNQLKNLTCDRIMSALERDGWIRDITRGATLAYLNRDKNRRVVIHYHPKKTYSNAKLLRGLLKDIGWNEKDLKRLKLIK